jgi:hypothetical protein
MKSIFSTIFLDKVKAAVDKRRCKVELNGDDEHHFELYKKLCINYWCSKYGDNALQTSQHSKTIAEYATSDQTPTPSEPLPKSISRLSPKRTSRSQTYLNDSTEIRPKRITRSQKQLDNVEDGKVPHTMVELNPNKRVLNMKELQGSIDGEMSQRPNKCSRTMEQLEDNDDVELPSTQSPNTPKRVPKNSKVLEQMQLKSCPKHSHQIFRRDVLLGRT